MRIWLDDERPMPVDYDVHCKTVQEALKVITEHRKEHNHIAFDNDLGQTEEGYHLAAMIEGMAARNQLKRMTWSIQSSNPSGRKNIELAMRSAERFWDKNEQ